MRLRYVPSKYEAASGHRCTFVTDPEVDEACGSQARWSVGLRVGTGRVVADPLLRCDTHVGQTVAALSPGSYRLGYFDGVTRAASPESEG